MSENAVKFYVILALIFNNTFSYSFGIVMDRETDSVSAPQPPTAVREPHKRRLAMDRGQRLALD